MNRLPIRLACLLLVSLPLCACASTPAVRTLATNTGVFVQSLTDGTTEFVRAQNRLNAQNEARLVRLDGYGVRSRTQVRQQRLVWTDMRATSRLVTHDLSTGTDANEVVAGMAVVERQPARIENGAGDGYRATLAALADVTAAPRPLNAFAEMFDFAQQVEETYRKLGEDAAAAASAAANSSASADQQGSAGAAATNGSTSDTSNPE